MTTLQRYPIMGKTLTNLLNSGCVALLICNCGIRTNGQSNPTQTTQEMTFKLENYKSPEAAQEKLSELLPKGTDNQELVKLMKESNIECSSSTLSVFCHSFKFNKNHSKASEWLIISEGENNKIGEISVQFKDNFNRPLKPEKSNVFRFENHETEDSAKLEINKIFPQGTQAEDFISYMEDLNANCKGPFMNREGNMIARCYYHIQASLITGWDWRVYAFLNDSDQTIESFEVYRQISAL